MREQEAEINDNLFLHCKAAMSLWNMCLCSLGVNLVMPKTTIELLSSWKCIGNRGRNEHYGEPSQHAYGGSFEKKGIQDALMDKRLNYRRLELIV